MVAGQDKEYTKEYTLGMGRLLGLFFGLAVLCAVSFGVGFTLGKSTTPLPSAVSNLIPAGTLGSGSKPSAAIAGAPAKPDCPTPGGCGTVSGGPGLDTNSQPAPAVAVHSNPAPAATPALSPLPAQAGQRPQPEVARPAVGGFVVQVAALGKQQDAQALTVALRRKQYEAFIANLPTDSLFHVQLGPFADAQEADAMRVRLMNDGYNPIVKR